MLTCIKRRPFLGKSRRGQTTVEFSLILLPFFIIFFATLDIAFYYFYDSELQNAMRETAHFTASGQILMQSNNGTNCTTNYNGFPVPLAVWDPLSGAPTEASRNECSKMFFKSNLFLPNVTWQSNIHLTSQTNVVPNLPQMAADGVTLYPSNLGPGNMTDYCQIVGTVPVAAITPLSTYLAEATDPKGSGYQMTGSQYNLRCSTITINEENYTTFKPYTATNSEETQ